MKGMIPLSQKMPFNFLFDLNEELEKGVFWVILAYFEAYIQLEYKIERYLSKIPVL